MTQRQGRYNQSSHVDTRLSRLETIIEGISAGLDKIQNKLDQDAKINWTPIGIGITVFFTVVGCFATIYSSKLSATDDNIKSITTSTQALAVASTEQRIALQTMSDRQTEFKNSSDRRLDDLDQKVEKTSERVAALELKKQKSN